MTPIKLIVFDVDGTLTPGDVHLDGDGAQEHKHFHIADGLGFRMAQKVGVRLAVISGRNSGIVVRRMAKLDVHDVQTGIENKAAAVMQLMRRYDLGQDEVASVGDDLNDLPVFDVTGVAIAVANAVPMVKRQANHITALRGGFGAGREAIEWVLRRQGQLSDAHAQTLALHGQAEVQHSVQ